MRNEKICNLALSYGRIAKIAAQFSRGLVNLAMGQIPCSTERISSYLLKFLEFFIYTRVYNARGLKTEKIKTAELARGPECHQ